MKKTLFALGMALALFLAAGMAEAEKRLPVPAMRAGEEVKTDAYTVTIPQGWVVPQVAKLNQPGAPVVFATENGNMAITLTTMESAMSTKEMAEQTAANMTKGGMKTTTPEEKDGLWSFEMEAGGKKGLAYFGGKDKIRSVTIIMGENLQDANVLLKSLKPAAPGLVPLEVE